MHSERPFPFGPSALVCRTMFRIALAATTLLLTATPSTAQSQQDTLDARYERALAAGYKALFLCSALGTDRTGTGRTEQSVIEYELTGVYDAVDPVVRDLPHNVERGADGLVDYVTAEWADDMPPRVAVFRQSLGCALLPTGALPPGGDAETSLTDRGGAEGANTLEESFAAGVQRVADAALGKAYGQGSRTTAILIRQADRTRAAAFAPGFDKDTPQRTWSVAKSLAATVVGAAVQRGEAQVDASAGLGADDSDPRRAITIDHLLRMASGRYSDTPGNRTDPLYLGGSTVAETALHWPLLHTPGSVYRYANNDTLAAIMAIGDTLSDHPPHELFRRIGMYDTWAETDWQGDYILSSQVWTSSADLARFGQLHLDDGVRDGERILPEGWLEYISSPAGPQPEGRPFGYGAGWWLFNQSEGVPPDTIAAMGNRGQYVVVVPSRDVVIVRRGEDPAGQGGFDIAAFTRDVLATLED